MIGVVIPYYQRAPGLLSRALRSIAAQPDAGLRIYVVDDGSPASAEAELARLPAVFPHEIVLLKQANGGPGAARNRALEAMTEDVEAVAFLDSDDIWSEEHVGNAAAALAAGADFYFSDHRREGEPDTRFRQCRYSPDGPALSARRGVYWCDPASVFHAVVARSPVGTSTVVVRRSRIGPLRFSDRLRSAGEDSIFWLELLGQAPRTACGVRNEVAYGRGVNIFSHGSWGDARALQTTLDEMRSQHLLRTHFALTPELKARSLAQSRRLDLSFCAGLIACARRGRWDAAGPAAGYVSQRPWALLRMPEAVLQAVRRPERDEAR